jgi:hypothetical protein
MTMFVDTATAGSWDTLTARLTEQSTLQRWAQREPVLANVKDLQQLSQLLCPGADRQRADELLGALVRLAAADGADEPDAVLLVLHLLSDGALVLAARLADLTGDPIGLVVGELTVQIRSFPWRRRHRAYAANLLLDTKKALWLELRPHRTRTHPEAGEVLIDPTDARAIAGLFDSPVAGPGEQDDLDLQEVFAWAQATGVAQARDLELLLDIERNREFGGNVQVQLARTCGMSERTLRRHRDRALTALQAARTSYLASCA